MNLTKDDKLKCIPKTPITYGCPDGKSGRKWRFARQVGHYFTFLFILLETLKYKKYNVILYSPQETLKKHPRVRYACDAVCNKEGFKCGSYTGTAPGDTNEPNKHYHQWCCMNRK